MFIYLVALFTDSLHCAADPHSLSLCLDTTTKVLSLIWPKRFVSRKAESKLKQLVQ